MTSAQRPREVAAVRDAASASRRAAASSAAACSRAARCCSRTSTRVAASSASERARSSSACARASSTRAAALRRASASSCSARARASCSRSASRASTCCPAVSRACDGLGVEALGLLALGGGLLPPPRRAACSASAAAWRLQLLALAVERGAALGQLGLGLGAGRLERLRRLGAPRLAGRGDLPRLPPRASSSRRRTASGLRAAMRSAASASDVTRCVGGLDAGALAHLRGLGGSVVAQPRGGRLGLGEHRRGIGGRRSRGGVRLDSAGAGRVRRLGPRGLLAGS